MLKNPFSTVLGFSSFPNARLPILFVSNREKYFSVMNAEGLKGSFTQAQVGRFAQFHYVRPGIVEKARDGFGSSVGSLLSNNLVYSNLIDGSVPLKLFATCKAVSAPPKQNPAFDEWPYGSAPGYNASSRTDYSFLCFAST